MISEVALFQFNCKIVTPFMMTKSIYRQNSEAADIVSLNISLVNVFDI